MTATAPPVLFCPRCDTWLDGRAICPACDWEAPVIGAAPGAERWRRRLPHRSVSPFAHLAAARDRYFVCTELDTPGRGRQGIIYALEARTGNIVWQYEHSGAQVTRHPVVHGELLLLASEDTRALPTGESNQLLALDTATGDEVWRYGVPAHSLSSPAFLGERLFFTASNGRGYCLSAADGALIWECSSLPSWAPGRPAVGVGAFFVGGWTNRLTQINADDGRHRAIFDVADEKNWFSTPPAALDARLFATSWDGQLFALDAGSGELLWSCPAGRGATAPLAADPYVYVPLKEAVDADGTRSYALHAYDPAGGELVWRYSVSHHFRAPLLLYAGLLIAGCDDGQLHAVDAANGTLQWQLDIGEKVRCAPAVSGESLAFCLADGTVAAVDWRPAPAQIELAAAESYRQSEEWEWAGLSAVLAGDLPAAADDFIRAGRPFRAAQLFQRIGQYAEAAQAYAAAGRHRRAAAAFLQAGEQSRAADEWAAAGDFEIAGKQYEELGALDSAAVAYEKAGAMTQAALCHERAGNIQRAAQIYLALKQAQPAARLYAAAGELERAAAILVEAGLVQEAATLLTENEQLEPAAKLLVEAGQPQAAAAIWQAAGRHDEAARIFEVAERWSDAADSWLEAGQVDEAARCYELAGDLWRAGSLHYKQRQWKRALDVYTKLKALDLVARLWEELGDWPNAAATYRAMNPPDRVNAARCYIEAGDWERAAQQYEKGELWSEAADSWKKAGNPARAVELLTGLKRLPEAAQLLEEAGDYSAAAELWRRHGDLEQTARLYELAGEPHKVLDLLTESGNWRRVVDLAHELDEFEREAEACLILAEEASATERDDLYLAAAQAYERAARRQESLESDTLALARLWELAAKYYEMGLVDPPEKAIECRREALRLRGWPELAVTVKAEGELVAEQYHSLIVWVTNVGFGTARLITVRVMGDLFEGDAKHTQQIPGLRQGQKRLLALRVSPRKSAVGTAVPMDMEISYQTDDEQSQTRNIQGKVTVQPPRDSQWMTPRPEERQPTINVYSDSVEIFGGQAQKGDKIEIRRGGLGNEQPADRSAADISEEPTVEALRCPNCRRMVTPDQKFCPWCQHALQ